MTLFYAALLLVEHIYIAIILMHCVFRVSLIVDLYGVMLTDKLE